MKFDSIFGAGFGILGTIVLCDFLRFLRRVLKLVVFWSSFIHKLSFREQSNFCESFRKASYLEKYNFLIKKIYRVYPTIERFTKDEMLNFTPESSTQNLDGRKFHGRLSYYRHVYL